MPTRASRKLMRSSSSGPPSPFSRPVKRRFSLPVMREGFLTLPGGHRIGICGTLALRDGETVSVRDVSSLCIRVSGEPSIRTEHLLERLTEPTLILGPPGSGKTTLLRACIRLLSDAGRRVSLADDRGEVAACWHGVPQRNVGMHTDVLTGGRKMQSVLWLLRTMDDSTLVMNETDPAGSEALTASGSAADAAAGTDASDYFAQMRLSRQQSRDDAVELLEQTIAYDDGTQVGDSATETLNSIVSNALSESQIESLIIAKGYDDCVAYIHARRAWRRGKNGKVHQYGCQ